MYRKTYLEINLDHLVDNYKLVQDRIGDKKVIPVVKANAYGHGVVNVVQKLVEENVKFFAVSLLEEALELRQVFPNIDLMMMGVCNEDDFFVASKNKVQVTIGNQRQLEQVLSLNRPIKVHIKIDTGMHRLGFKDLDQAVQAFQRLQKSNHVNLVGVYTHFATADNDYDYYLLQKAKFEEFLTKIDHQHLMVHASNSSSAIKYEDSLPYTSHVRLGISLYGLTLDKETKFLKNTCRLITHISEVKELKKGEKLGYGANYQAKQDEKIGVLPIGYADGFIRKNQGGYAEIQGYKCEIIGRICMDQMFVRLVDHMTIDQEVILFGGMVSIDDVAKRLDTINYEVICQITSRVPRTYI